MHPVSRMHTWRHVNIMHALCCIYMTVWYQIDDARAQECMRWYILFRRPRNHQNRRIRVISAYRIINYECMMYVGVLVVIWCSAFTAWVVIMNSIITISSLNSTRVSDSAGVILPQCLLALRVFLCSSGVTHRHLPVSRLTEHELISDQISHCCSTVL